MTDSPDYAALEAMEKAIGAQLIAATVASCTCGTKSHEAHWHEPTCRYRLLQEITENFEALVPSLIAEAQTG